jgi:methionine biosynthesis protein MetW
MTAGELPLDHKVILDWVRPGSTVLDLGCGGGELLELLVREKKAVAQGIEIDEQAIYACVARGLSVFHEDIDNGLTGYGNKSFDYVILNQSLQQARKLDTVMLESLRIGKAVIIGFPNFAHYSARCQMFFLGKTPVTPALPYEWHDTPNLHFLSIYDFGAYCSRRGIRIEKTAFISESREVKYFPNLFARIALFLIAGGSAYTRISAALGRESYLSVSGSMPK